MNKYDITFIVRPDIDENAAKNVFESMKNVLTSCKANILEEKDLGQRELAYEIKKYKNGYYFYFLIEAENANATSEFDRVALINENIIRHLVVRVDE